MTAFTQAEAVQLIRDKALAYYPEGVGVVSGSSKWYCDVKHGLSHGGDLLAIAELAIQTVRGMGITFNTVGGPTMGADCISSVIAYASSHVDDPFPCEWFSVRKKIEDERPSDGKALPFVPRFAPSTPDGMFWLEGARPDATSKVLWVEDTISTGTSVKTAMERFRQHPTARDAQIIGALAIVDRGDAATELFAGLKIPYAALVTYKDLGIPHIGQG